MRRVGTAVLVWAAVSGGTVAHHRLADAAPGTAWFAPMVAHAQQPPATPPSGAQSMRETLDRYCVRCHNQRMKSGGLSLDDLDPSQVGAHAAVWERVLEKLRTREMPPPALPRPDPGTYASLTPWIAAELERAADRNPNPGRVAIHRLNRAEYGNAIRDLLAIEIDSRATLPGDDADQHGFENIAGILSVSPALLERYVSAAKRYARLAIGDTTMAPVFETYQTPKLVEQDDRASEELPFGSRGGLAVRHWFPVDGDYVVRISLKRQLYDYIVGIGRRHQLELRVDQQRVKLFAIGGDAPGTPTPFTFAGNMLSDPEWEQYMHEADAGLEVRFHAKAGPRIVGAAFLETPTEAEGVLQPEQIGFDRAVNERYDGDPGIDTIAIGGPYNAEGPGESPSRRRIFVCRPASASDEEPCARRVLTTLARRAYRREPTADDLQTLMTFYRSGRQAGGFEQGVRRALERLLSGPDFLFRIEQEPAGVPKGAAYQVSSVDLASRLSFFLWSSIPDDELLTAALQDTLKDPAVLDRQVRRMLADRRSQALVQNFASQWLELGKLRGFSADPDLFPEFDDGLKQAMQEETELFLDSQLREDRSVGELLTADYTFLNERLARHYGITDVYGSRFRRVPLANTRRGGLLGQGSILALTSYPNRTSPVLRGKWILDNVLGTPPPPPPADVPGLKETRDDGKPATMRGLMEQHRKDPACAGCHVRMDPLGFSLENFDAVGRWRSGGEGDGIDATAILPDGTAFEGLNGLREVMQSHRPDFALTVARKMLTYALGREVEYYDLPAVRRIVTSAAARDYRWSALVSGVVTSMPFQMRRSES